MDRGSSTAFRTEIVKSANKPFHLVKVTLDSASYYLSDAYIPVTFSGNTYTPTGSFLNFSDIVETNDATIEEISISLSGIDRTYTDLFLAENYLDRQIDIYKAFLDTNDALVSDPLLIFSGRLNNPVLKEDVDSGTSTLSLSAASLFVDFERISVRFTNNESQQSFFSGDTGFRFSSVIVKELNWGATTGSTVNGGGSAHIQSQGSITSPINNTAPSEKSIFNEVKPSSQAFSLIESSGTVFLHINYANRSTANFSVGQRVKINGFESKTFDDGETVLSSFINASEGADTHAITAIDADGFGFTIAKPSTVTSVKSGKFGGSEITVEGELVVPVLIETTNGSNAITVNTDNFSRVGDLVYLFVEDATVGGIAKADFSKGNKITARTTDSLTVTMTKTEEVIANPLLTTSGSTTLTIDIAQHNLAVSDSITISGATAIGGVPASDINKTHTVATIVSENQITVVVSTSASSTARGGGSSVLLDGFAIRTNPIETTSGSATIKVHHANHGLSNGDTITINRILNNVGGIAFYGIEGEHTVVDASATNFFTVTLNSFYTATSSAVGGGIYATLVLPNKATSSVNYGSVGSRLSISTEIR